MAGQLNPAWRRKPASSNHLAKISARFLSDAPETGQGNDLCRVIPFLMDSPAQSWIADELCRVLTKKGQSSLLYPLSQLPDAEQTRLSDELSKMARGYRYCLLPLTSADKLRPNGLDHVVLLVSASLPAVRTAYQRIKSLSEHKAPEIGVVVVGPRDQHSAWRYFRKLAVGSLRYLDVPLLNLGFLPEQVTPGHNPADHHRENFLARISERLLRSEFYAGCATQKSEREDV